MTRSAIKVDNPKDQVLVAKTYAAEQGHIFRFWGELDAGARRQLLDQVDAVDFQLLTRLVRRLLARDVASPLHPKRLEPTEVLRLPTTEAERTRHEDARARGEDLLRAGKVGLLVVAGGQGSRLGIDGPKGCFPIGPTSDRTLFQHFAEATRAVARRYKIDLPLYVMTSPSNHEATVQFFEANGRFGLPSRDLRFFSQQLIPAVDRQGKILLADHGSIFLNPNGHGGVFPAARESGVIEDMRTRGIEAISYFQVDNPIVPVADPVFLGFHALANADMSLKVVAKRDPTERVGVACLADGTPAVIEYSDLPEELAQAREPGGSLRFGYGSIAVHILSVDFMDRMGADGSALPYHLAEKAISTIDTRGEKVSSPESTGFKFETFIFDALPLADESVVLEVDRAEEFAPVKNAEGEDSPHTARQAISDRNAAWMREAGIPVPTDAAGHAPVPIEISPLFALTRGELADKIAGMAERLDFSRPVLLLP